MNRRTLALVTLLLSGLAACGKEVHWAPATQVIIALRSNLGDELARVEAVIYDAQGQKRGDSHTFELNGARSLPLSFSVVPTLPQTTQFLVVLSGRAAQGEELLQTRAIVNFVKHKSVGVELWLYAGCLGRSCEAEQTCTAALASGQVDCVAVPVLESVPVVPGQELDTASTTADAAMGAADAGLDARGPLDSALAPDSAPTLDAPPMLDATADAAPSSPLGDATSSDTMDSVCFASPGRAICVDAVLHHCDAQGQSATQDRCASARLCVLGQDKAQCAPCEPGTFRCTGTRLERCSTDGFNWELSKTCSSDALCNSGAGDCTTSVCTASTLKCMGNDLYGCSLDLTQLALRDQCAPGMCDEAEGECDVCVPNAKTCSGDVAQSCDSHGRQVTTTPCSGSTPKCTGTGQCVQCFRAEHCPVPSSPCVNALCNGTPPRCATANKAAREPCPGGVCDGSGKCIGCVQDADCTVAGQTKCLNQQCVQCKTSGDCSTGYECSIVTHACQRISLAGTATSASCSSYGMATATQCAGYYCGVTPERLASALTTGMVCNLPASLVCSGALPTNAGKCARDLKTMNPFDSNAQLAPKIEACIRNVLGAQVSGVSSACIGCYVNAENCANTDGGCLFECLASAGPDCDACRLKKNCDQPVFGCAGLPSPL